MNFYIQLLQLALKGLAPKIAGKKQLQQLIQRELNQVVLIKNQVPNVAQLAKAQLTSSEIKQLQTIFRKLQTNPQQLLGQLITNPNQVNQNFDNLTQQDALEVAQAIDFLLPPQDGSWTTMISVQSSWIRAIQYRTTPRADTYEYRFTTKQGRGPYGPDLADKRTIIKMATQSNAGTTMWREVPYWVSKRAFVKKQTQIRKALAGF